MKKAKKYLQPKYEIELLESEKYTRVVGIDEVGRGCWAGPVAVGAFIYEFHTSVIEGVNDSKMLSKIQREKAYSNLSTQNYSVLLGSLKEINNVGIGKTVEHLIEQVIGNFYDNHTYFLIDGQFSNSFCDTSEKIIRGDSTHYSIAAASILAKVERDRLMEKLDLDYPSYGFAKHKGYGTKEHRFALSKFGVCELHRTSYIPIQKLLSA